MAETDRPPYEKQDDVGGGDDDYDAMIIHGLIAVAMLGRHPHQTAASVMAGQPRAARILI